MKQMIVTVTVMIAMAFGAFGAFADELPNYALNCEAFASSQESARYPAEHAVDGVPGTRWASGRSDDEWITLDLGQQRRIGRIILNWERSAGRRYAVQVSADNEHYEDVYQEDDGKQGEFRVIDFRPREARYVRIDCRERTTEYGFSLWEVEVYPPVRNLAARCRMSASAALPDNPASAVTNGVSGIGWRAPAGGKGQWIQLDLGTVRSIGRLVLDWGNVGAMKYTVELSEDGRRYTPVHKREDGVAAERATVTFPSQRTRYIRISCHAPFGAEGYGLDGIEAYWK